jgi:hypothetical protein
MFRRFPALLQASGQGAINGPKHGPATLAPWNQMFAALHEAEPVALGYSPACCITVI